MMTGDGEDDPFTWDVERVVGEMCTSDRTWAARAGSKMPDAAHLAEQLRFHEVSGDVLLTCADIAGSLDALPQELGVKKLAQKLALQIAVKQLQARSPGYRAWKKGHMSLLESSFDPSDANSLSSPKRSPGASLEPALPADTWGKANASTSAIDSTTIVTVKPPRSESPTGPPAKKRRLAPITMSSNLVRPAANPVPTEADENSWLSRSTWDGSRQALDADAAGAYLGSGTLHMEDILQSHVSGETGDGDEEVRNFSLLGPEAVPSGRRLQIHRVFKRYLRGHRSACRDDAALDTASDDPIVDVAGLSDEEVDQQTLREMQDEAAERARGPASKNKGLDAETVHQIIDDAIADFRSHWRELKLPKYERKANGIWNDARKHGTRNYQITAAREIVHKLEERMRTLRDKLSLMSWTSESKLRRQTESLERTVYDKEHSVWVLGVLARATEPARPPPTPSHPRRPPGKVLAGDADDDEEVLTSDSGGEDEAALAEAELDDFVVDDDDGPSEAGVASARSSGHIPDQRDDDEELLDLTQVEDDTEADAPFDNARAVAERTADYWRLRGDSDRLILTILYHNHRRRKQVLNYVSENDEDQLWALLVERALGDRVSPGKQEQNGTPELVGHADIDHEATWLAKLFNVYISPGEADIRGKAPLGQKTITEIRSRRPEFHPFYSLLSRIAQQFAESPDVGEAPKKNATQEADKPTSESSSQQPDAIPLGGQMAEDTDSGMSDDEPLPPHGKRKRRVARDEDARNLRERDRLRLEEQEQRAKVLRQKLQNEESVSHDETRLIINETKEDTQGLIYVHDEVAPYIKDHQIQGVRFMWNQIVADAQSKQGCLLAHTMGLGKTMQIITLLVAIARAASSPDPSIRSQIPEKLRQSKTLVLCPPALVDNWWDELLFWAPKGVLGDLRKIEATQKDAERHHELKKWAADGGVLIIGYHLFKDLMEDEELAELLKEQPSIVVGDEAHKMQNPVTKLHQAAAQFRTTTRIAMTGSPLANNVDEYHSMIDWVAPNYLGPRKEFRAVYTIPIKEGFFKDSEPRQRRQALKMLKVLKETVAPKVHRATITALKQSLPGKKEFILYLRLSPIQLKTYATYVRYARTDPRFEEQSNCLFKVAADLSLLLAHPKILRAKLGRLKNELDSATLQSKGKTVPDEDAEVQLPRNMISDLLTALSVRALDDITLSNKVLVLVKILDEARRSKDKVLVFSRQIPTLDYLEDMFKMQRRPYRRLDGKTPTGTRGKDVKEFNTGPDEIYLISTTAGGLGLNITGANRVVIFDFHFNPVHEQQAIGRAYRIGQSKPVYVYWLLFDGTIEKILQNQAVFKQQLQSRVVDKKNPIAWAEKKSPYYADPSPVIIQQDLTRYRGQDTIIDAIVDNAASSVTSIDVTETFEEQEPEEQLNEEERREVAEYIKRNLLRQQNPEEHRLQEEREREHRLAPAAGSAQPQQHPLTAAAPSPASTPQPVTPMASGTVMHPTSPGPPLFGTATDGGQSESRRTPAPGAALGQTDGAPDGDHEAVGPGPRAPIRPGAGRAAEPDALSPADLPIMGAATGFRTSLTPRQRRDGLPPLQEEAQKLASILQAAPCPKGVTDQRKLAHRIASQVADKLHTEGITGLPARRRWRKCHCMAEEPGYAEMLLTKALNPADFVTLPEGQLVQKREHVTPARDAAALSQDGDRQQDPDNLSSHLHRTLSKANDRAAGGHAQSDLMAIQEVMHRRAKKKQPDKKEMLPRWAQDAVNSRQSKPEPKQVIVIDDD